MTQNLTTLTSYEDGYLVRPADPGEYPGVIVAHSAPVTGLLDLGRYDSGVDDEAQVTPAGGGEPFSAL